jgi:hypothetical protein
MGEASRQLSDEDFMTIRRLPGPETLIAEFHDDHTSKIEWMARGPLTKPEDYFRWCIRAAARFHHLVLFDLDVEMVMETSGRQRKMTPSELQRFRTLFGKAG